MASSVAPLQQPITLKLSGKVIPNRLYRSALSEYSASHDDHDVEKRGIPLPRYTELHQELADGGAGLICFGNIPVHRQNLENYNNAILDRDNPWDAVAAFSAPVKAAKSRGGLCMPQLTFPGRQVPDYFNPNPKSSSDVQLEPSLQKTYGKPTPLTIAQIKDLISRFVWAAETLAKAGADGIVLHAAHGYIMNQFISPKINKRTDEYGGRLENRARFILEIVASIKEKLPSDRFVIGAKLNCQDFVEGGSTFAEQVVVMKCLEQAGVDFFDISGGIYTNPAWKGEIPEVAERMVCKQYGSFFLEWARDMKRVLSRAVIGTTGGWRDAQLMTQAVRNGDIDMCGLGRPLREDPGFVNKVLRGQARVIKL